MGLTDASKAAGGRRLGRGGDRVRAAGPFAAGRVRRVARALFTTLEWERIVA
jgi:hypothetical protein